MGIFDDVVPIPPRRDRVVAHWDVTLFVDGSSFCADCQTTNPTGECPAGLARWQGSPTS